MRIAATKLRSAAYGLFILTCYAAGYATLLTTPGQIFNTLLTALCYSYFSHIHASILERCRENR